MGVPHQGVITPPSRLRSILDAARFFKAGGDKSGRNTRQTDRRTGSGVRTALHRTPPPPAPPAIRDDPVSGLTITANVVFATAVGLLAGVVFYLLQCAFGLTSRLMSALLSLTCNGINYLMAE